MSAMEIAAELCIFTNDHFALAVAGEGLVTNGDLPLPEATAPKDSGDDEDEAQSEAGDA